MTKEQFKEAEKTIKNIEELNRRKGDAKILLARLELPTKYENDMVYAKFYNGEAERTIMISRKTVMDALVKEIYNIDLFLHVYEENLKEL